MVNKVILIGNVGMDPEVRTLEGGAKVARVRLATTERLYDRQANETKEHTEWHTLIFRRGLAGVVEMYVKKGTQLYVEGRIRSRQWEDASGVQHIAVEIYVDDMRMIGGRNREEISGQSVSGEYQSASPGVSAEPVREMQESLPVPETDDLPF